MESALRSALLSSLVLFILKDLLGPLYVFPSPLPGYTPDLTSTELRVT